MTGAPSADPALPTLAALRQARAARIAAIRRRGLPIGLFMVAVLGFAIVKSHPQPGLHGAPLGITIAGACYLSTLAILFRLAGGWLPLASARPVTLGALPLVMALLAASSVTLEWLQNSSTGTIGLYLIVAVAARAYSRRASAAIFGACLAFFVAVTVAGYDVWNGARHGLPGVTDVFAIMAVYLMSLFSRRIQVQQDQEERLLAELEESRAAELRAAALAERQRLAREMHDVLAHSLSGLVVQLEGARMLAAAAPGDPRLPEAVERAHGLAKSGLAEARQAIGMLRDDELPGPDRLSGLAGDFTTVTGVACRFIAEGEQRELSPAVQLALYRVAQEALTNVRKHAQPDHVQVRLQYLPGAVTLTVEDAGGQPARPPSPVGALSQDSPGAGGYGLTGMRERAELLGGTLEAGPTEKGFGVRLRVPA